MLLSIAIACLNIFLRDNVLGPVDSETSYVFPHINEV